MDILEYENYQEKKTHFDAAFPYNTYPCSIPQDFLSVPLHWHTQTEVIYIKKGSGMVSIDLATAPVKEGDIIFIAPGQLHEILQNGSFSMEYENILFDLAMLMSKNTDSCTADFLEPLQYSYTPAKNIYRPQDKGYANIAGCLNRADEISRTTPHAYQLAIKGCLFSLLYELFLSWQETPAEKKHSLPLEKLKIIIKYVETHFQERITIADIASHCDYSQSHFMKYFKRAMGIPFIEYLNDYRLMMAARLLLASDATVLSVADEVGFENLSHFNRSFKKKFGKTPRDFRQGA